MELRKWYIKRWWVVAIGWLLLSFLPITVIQLPWTGKTAESIFRILLFPMFIIEPFLENTEIAFMALPYYFLGYLIPCFILAQILALLEKKKEGKEINLKKDLKKWYIKRWWIVGISWFIAYILSFILFTVDKISKEALMILYFPTFIFIELFGDFSKQATHPIIILFYLVPCYLLAKILESRHKKMEQNFQGER